MKDCLERKPAENKLQPSATPQRDGLMSTFFIAFVIYHQVRPRQ